MSPPESLQTERLVLRRHKRSDARAIAAQLNNWNVVRWLAQVPFPYLEQDALEWISQTGRAWSQGREFQFVVTLAGSGGLIGHAGLRLDGRPTVAELGYWFGEEFWGQGYASETARALLAFGFDRVGLERVWATALPNNDRSLNVLRKAGLSQVATRQQYFSPIRSALTVPVFALTRDAYRRPDRAA